MMNADDAYAWLTGASLGASADAFDVHVAASILAMAFMEADPARGISLADGAGLTGEEIVALAQALFPAALDEITEAVAGTAPVIEAEERSVRDIMLMYSSGKGPLEKPFAGMVARRCRAPHHLWQDLGLRNRGELSQLMQRHFAPLSKRNSGDMKWKKFLYRLVCGSAGFTLCAAPVCSDCDDFEHCFGEETGESRLAQIARAAEVAAAT
ncbi:nitrogen fixation protein NifQ [Breoghania sp. JC706]|uniref:nitrogen fixation protein NifQ n=1 Tax=Breoghania sp. JC706 TaxID=3117732 RepID=UPI0030098D72